MSGTREIEVKYSVDDLAALEVALKGLDLVLSPPIHQDDQAYAEVGWQYGMSKIGRSFVRLRTEGDRHVFTLKHPEGNELACREYETQVADRAQMHAAILAMGFYPTMRIVKTRRSARYGELSLCVDDVEHLGAYFEIERIVGPSESGEAVQTELDRFARWLGVELRRTTNTYDSLLRAAQVADV